LSVGILFWDEDENYGLTGHFI